MLFLAWLILIYNPMQAQNQISGIITDQDHHTLPGAVIYIPEINKGTVSDSVGKYILVNLPNGKIKIQFSYIGYKNVIETVNLKGSQIELNITLKQTSIEAEEVVVSGGYNSTQHDNAVKIDVIKLNTTAGINTPNLCEKLSSIPGIDMISKGSGEAKPVIRGLSMNDILVLNNGVRFENYQYSDHHPLGIDESGLDNIEIIKGPASLLYGSDAVGGVIDFIKEKPAPVGKILGDYNLQLFSNSLGATNNLGIKGTSKRFFGGFRFGNKTFSDYLQGGGEFVPNTRFSGNSFRANAGINDRNISLNLYYDYSSYKVGLAEEDAVDYLKAAGRGRNPEVYFMSLDNHLISARNKIYLNKYKLELNAAYQKSGLIHAEGPGDISIEMELRTLTYEARLYLPSTKNSEYIVGFQGLNQVNKNLHDRETVLLPDANTNNYSGFGLFQYTFFNKLKLQTGIRYDQKMILTKEVDSTSTSSRRPALEKSYSSFSGSFGGTYNRSEELLFRFNFAAAYRTPNLAELTSNGLHESRYEKGDNNLVPENAYETDLSIHYHAEYFTFDIAGFYNIINNYIFISPTADTTRGGDKIYKYLQSNAFLYGVEAGFRIQPEKINWLHFEITFSNVTGKQYNNIYLPFIPADKIHTELKLEKKKLGFLKNAFFKAASQKVFAQNNPAYDETATSGYILFDLGLGGNISAIKQLISIGFSINNIMDTKYVDHLSTLKEVGYFNPGRNFTLNLKIPFECHQSNHHNQY